MEDLTLPKPKAREKKYKPLRTRKLLKRKAALKGKPNRRGSSLKYLGKVASDWQFTRKQWLGSHEPDHAGFYICGLCGRHVHVSEVVLDHIMPRSKAPELEFELSNLQPAHQLCNGLKGSKTMEQWRILQAAR